MKVPFLDLAAQYDLLRDEIDSAFQEVCASCSFVLGPQVEAFENAFAQFLEAKYCVGVASGTDALVLSFRALGIGPGDEVLIPANTFVATAIGVEQAGAKPVLVDINPDTYLIDTGCLKDASTSKTKAICPVHLYGRACNMDEIMGFAQEHSLFVIEDAAQAHGARWNGKRVGTLGDLGCFSFYPGKNLGAYGDGGAIIAKSEELFKKLRRLRNYGSEIKYEHPEKGTNSRLDSIQAAVLHIKLKYLEEWNLKRRKAAETYTKLLQPLTETNGLVIPSICTSEEHVFHLYVVHVENRRKVMDYLAENNIESGIHYPKPIHLQEGYKDIQQHLGDLPVTEQLACRIVSLPMFPEITEEQIKYVVDKVREVLDTKRQGQ